MEYKDVLANACILFKKNYATFDKNIQMFFYYFKRKFDQNYFIINFCYDLLPKN